jgi:hypothetical protein
MKRLLFALAALMSAASVYAAETTGTPLAEALGDLVVNTLLPVLVALAGTLASIALYRLKAWLKIKTSAEFDIWVSGRAEEAVQYVGETAAAKLKTAKVKMTGSEKLNIAVARLIERVPSLSREQAEMCVHAALARVSGEGATGKKVIK